ncbi:unnamed protein product, partial [marine sediment metagenome]
YRLDWHLLWFYADFARANCHSGIMVANIIKIINKELRIADEQ